MEQRRCVFTLNGEIVNLCYDKGICKLLPGDVLYVFTCLMDAQIHEQKVMERLFLPEENLYYIQTYLSIEEVGEDVISSMEEKGYTIQEFGIGL